jgi:hypothetical protein
MAPHIAAALGHTRDTIDRADSSRFLTSIDLLPERTRARDEDVEHILVAAFWAAWGESPLNPDNVDAK